MNAVDMAQFIAPKSDQLNADDLIAGPRTITITKVSASPDAAEQPVSIHFNGDDGKPFKPCKSMRRVMVAVWGADASKYVGRSLTLFRDPNVKFGGMQVGGIRISHMSHLDEKKTMALTETRAKRAPFTVLPLADKPVEDAAQKWASGFIAKLDSLGTVEAVDAWQNEKAAKLAELQKARPDLHQNVDLAIAQRKAALAPELSFTDDMPDDEPDFGMPSEETPTPPEEQPAQVNDSHHEGDASNGGKSDAEKAVDEEIVKLDAATSPAELEKLIKKADAHRVFLADSLVMKLEAAYDRNRKRLEQVEEPAK